MTRFEMTTVRRGSTIAASIALGCAAVLSVPPPAAAAGAAGTSVRVQGVQLPVKPELGLSRMQSDPGHAGLVGEWTTEPLNQLPLPPWYFETGRERFDGCLDLNGDNSCTDEPTGRLFFDYAAWVRFDPTVVVPPFRELSGGCVHPITGGTGAFDGATGLLTMRDRLVDNKIRTTYRGTVTLAAGGGSTDRSSSSDVGPSAIARVAGSPDTAPRVC